MKYTNILSGKLKGRKIKIVSTSKTRPTLSKVKEAIFQFIDVYEGDLVLDMFAGTGALGIECLSQGASFVQFIEKNPINAKLIRTNLKDLKIDNFKYGILVNDFKIGLKKFSKVYDIVLIDPPFEKVNYYYDALIMLQKNKLIDRNSQVMVESRKLHNIEIPEIYNIEKQKFYGDSRIDILTLK